MKDEKRSLIKLNDIIVLKKESNLSIFFKCKVIVMLNYRTFNEFIADYPIKVLADESISKEELHSKKHSQTF